MAKKKGKGKTKAKATPKKSGAKKHGKAHIDEAWILGSIRKGLNTGGKMSGEIFKKFGVKYSMSKALKKLESEGKIKGHQEGRAIIYSVKGKKK